MAIAQFSAHWGRYTEIQPYQQKWLAKYSNFATYGRGKCIYDPEWQEERVFYVCSGLVGRIVQKTVLVKVPKTNKPSAEQEDEIENEDKTSPQLRRRILSVGIPGMALMSTDHLYSSTQSIGEIVALRPCEVLTIDYEAIRRFMIDDPSLNGMLYALANKKKRQLARLRQLNSLMDPQSAYLKFADTLPELYSLLSQTEQQDLLGISRRTISRASYLYATGKPKR